MLKGIRFLVFYPTKPTWWGVEFRDEFRSLSKSIQTRACSFQSTKTWRAFQLVLVSTRGSSSLEGNASRNLRDYSGRCSDVTSGFILKYWLKRRTAYLQKQMSREVWVCCALNVTVCEKQCWRVQSHPRKSKSMVEYCAWIKAHSPQKKCDAWIEQEHKSIK